jgi:hypothetical protein
VAQRAGQLRAGYVNREIDRIPNRLERLQRMRKGQPVSPQVNVEVTL